MHTYAGTNSQQSPSSPLKTAIVGARGYSGLQLARLLLQHPCAELKGCLATGSDFSLKNYLPEITAQSVPTWPVEDIKRLAPEVDVIFLATPAEVSLELAPQILEAGTSVIDLSGAFRLSSTNYENPQTVYKQYYGFVHTELEWLSKAHYGLQPFANIPNQSLTHKPGLVANPGCYATAVLMALLPLLKTGLLAPESIVIDAKSGATGAGRKASEALLFCEVDADCKPYKVGSHQHLPEISQLCASLAGTDVMPFFTTHLLPIKRGLLASIYARPARHTSDGELREKIQHAYNVAFEGYPFVKVTELNNSQAEKSLAFSRVVGSPRTHIGFSVTDNKIYIFSVIDNLLKGAASQAIENFNVLFNIETTKGLNQLEGVL